MLPSCSHFPFIFAFLPILYITVFVIVTARAIVEHGPNHIFVQLLLQQFLQFDDSIITNVLHNTLRMLLFISQGMTLLSESSEERRK